MTTQEAKRIRRNNRLAKPVKLSKKRAKKWLIEPKDRPVEIKRKTGKITFQGKKVSMRKKQLTIIK